MGLPSKLLCLLLVLLSSIQIDSNRSKRMFALCPPHFIRIGNECYFISQNRVNWLDAHFECKDRNSHLAEPYRQEDRVLRKYLNHLQQSRPLDIWIGARFNWERNKWQWGHNGKDLTYQSFSQMSADNKDLKFHCAILKPNLKYRWSASSCEQQHQYICQHRMPYVNEKNRQKIYSKWNETYPNEMANEIEVVLSEDDLSRRRRRMHRAQMKTTMNNRQNKDGFNRQRNSIQFSNGPKRDQLKYPTRKTRMGGNRQRNNHEFGRQFELNRNRAGGVRHQIQFNNTNTNTHNRPSNGRNANRVWRQKHRSNNPGRRATTVSPTVWPSTSWIAPTTIKPTAIAKPSTATAPTTTTTFVPPNVISNDVTQYNDNQNRQQIEETERHRQEEKLRKKEAEHLWRLEQERLKEMRERDDQERRQRNDEDRRQREKNRALENEPEPEPKQNERKQQEHREQSERNKYEYTHDNPHANEVMQQPDTQTDSMRQQNEQTNDERAVQTNEIFGETVSTTLSPLEQKKLKRKLIRDRISKLSPEEQQLFFQRRAEKRNKKRDN